MIRGMLGGLTTEQWIARYERSHQHPVNRVCHTCGIPAILISLALFFGGFFLHRLWILAVALFVLGWVFQFVGHIFEGKPPEFFPRLALPIRRCALVVGQDPRPRLVYVPRPRSAFLAVALWV